MILKTLLTLSMLSLSSLVWADCSMEQTWCETSCKVKYIGDETAKNGCLSRCVAERAVCSTKAGAESAYESGKEIYKESQVVDQTIGCDRAQEICNLNCDNQYPNDQAARAGCKSKCVAERAACSTSVGAGKAADVGKDAWEGTKSFFKGLTE